MEPDSNPTARAERVVLRVTPPPIEAEDEPKHGKPEEDERGVVDERRGGRGQVQERLGVGSLQAAVGEEDDGVVGEGDDGEGDVEAIGGSASVDEGEGENGEADHGGDASVDHDDRFVRVALAGALGLVDHGTRFRAHVPRCRL